MDELSRRQAAGLQSALEDHVAACAGAGRDCSGCVMAPSVQGPIRQACADGDAARLWREVMTVAPRAMGCRHGCAAGVDLLLYLMRTTRDGFRHAPQILDSARS